MSAWHLDTTTVNSVAHWAVDNAEVLTLSELLYFYEKPWKYGEWHDAWMAEQ